MSHTFSESSTPTDDGVAETILAMCMSKPESAETATSLLSDDDFSQREHRSQPLASVFRAIASLVGKNKRPAPPLVAEEMRRLGLAKEQNLTPILTEIMRSYVGSGDVTEYCKILRRYTTRRRIRESGLKLLALAEDDRYDTDEYTAQTEAIAAEVTLGSSTTVDPKLMGDVVRQRLEMHKARAKGEYPGLRTGFKAIDAMLRGMQPADYIIIAGRPSMGKTALAQNIGDNVVKAGGAVLLITKEMPAEPLADRYIMSEGGINGGLMRAGMVDSQHWVSAELALERTGIYTARYFLDDQSSTVPQIRQTAIRIKRKYGLDLLIADYLQLFEGHGKYKTVNKVVEVGEISKAFKLLAKELGIPLIVVSQLSRSVEQREDKRPILSDLRDTGNIEQDADVVTFVYRDAYYNPDSPKGNMAEIIIAKHRNGPVGTVEAEWLKERTKFLNPHG